MELLDRRKGKGPHNSGGPLLGNEFVMDSSIVLNNFKLRKCLKSVVSGYVKNSIFKVGIVFQKNDDKVVKNI